MEQEMYIKRLPHAEVLDLRTIVPVAEQQICSLAMVQRPSLNVTLFSLDQGQTIGGHASPGDAMVQLLSGQARITIGEQDYIVRAGESIIMPARVTHALYAEEAFQMLLMVVKPERER